MNKVTVVIPSLNPDEKLLQVVKGVRAQGFEDILLINDGSAPEHICHFEACKAYPEVTVLTHEVNRGKGAALKTAIAYIQENRPDSVGIVTADGDNQHHAEDILACAEKMAESEGSVILGVRDFSGPEVPPRSKFGNRMTSFVFFTGVGLKITDTQTGLRAIPAKYFPIFLKTKGDRYEYETNMLLDLKAHHIPFEQITIRTIYIDENQTSHFHPIRDSVRIYAQILKFCAGSLGSTLIDYLAFLAFSAICFQMLDTTMRIFVATVAARAISSLVNFWCNRSLVFASDGKVGPALVRYYCLAIPQMLLSAGLVRLLTILFGNSAIVITTLLKVVVDTVLFFASFTIQKRWVFRKK